MPPNKNILAKVLAALGAVCLLVVIVILLQVPPADRYEISIYQVYPWYFWAFAIASILTGQLLLLRKAFWSKNDDRLWMYGILQILIVNGLLMFMPYIRGYPTYGRADVLTHLGIIRSITATGSLGNNIYPALHLLTTSLSYATGLEAMRVINVIPPILSFLFAGAMYFLLQEIFDDSRKVLCVLVFSLLLIGGTTHILAVPYTTGFLLTPFVLYLFAKERRFGSRGVRITLLLVLVSYIVYHPLTSLFLILIFGIFFVMNVTPWFHRASHTPANVFVFVGVVFGTWYFNFTGIILRIGSFFESILGMSTGQSDLSAASSAVSRTSPDLIDIFRIALFQQGTAAILIGLASMYIAFDLFIRRREIVKANEYLLFFVVTLVNFVGLSVAFLAGDFVAAGYGRPLVFARYFALLPAGMLFHRFWRQFGQIPLLRRADSAGSREGVTAAFLIVILVLNPIVVFSLHFSPLQARTNHQVTDMEIEGTGWTFEHQNESMLIEEFGIDQYRYHDLHYGFRNKNRTQRPFPQPPRHFGYAISEIICQQPTETDCSGESLAEAYDENRYLILTRLGRTTFPAKFPDYRQFWAYTPEDFSRLESDPSVSRIYDNGDFNSYVIYGSKDLSNQPTPSSRRWNRYEFIR